LDRENDHYLLHAGDGYWGWVPCGAVQPMTAEAFNAYMDRKRAIAQREIKTQTLVIPRGATLRLQQSGADTRTVSLPDGTSLDVPADTLGPVENGEAAAARVKAALDLLYVPYVFGGRSPLGLDCSGLASNVCTQAGRTPARDARQQVLAGRLVATFRDRSRLQAGDQVFFVNRSGKVYHTGIAIDSTHIVHSAPPCVQIGSIDSASPLYDKELDESFFMAKRP